MKNIMMTFLKACGFSLALALAHVSVAFSAAPVATDYQLLPPVLSRSETPLVMLGLSIDNQLFYKAYSDYSDVDGDGNVDLTYKDTFDYYGYFESRWCYSYDTSNSRFKPMQLASGTNSHSCSSAASPWSGNFLNWATMTRMDVLRRVMYGGLRSTDTSSLTILERAYLPNDVHAFAKVYTGTDVADFTPWKASDLKDNSISFCNVSSSHPYTASSKPILRIAQGKYRRWSADSLRQCTWDEGTATNKPAVSDRLNHGSEHVVRIESCVTGKDSVSTNCRQYSSTNKPFGLLQQYGEEGELKFGLVSGSYDKYISGGTLRKNISVIAGNSSASDDEVNLIDGTFNSSVKGIINTMDLARIRQWDGSKYQPCNKPGVTISEFVSGSTYACRDWGNPVSEIYLEALRYIAGASSETSVFKANDDISNYVLGLKTAAWPATADSPLNSTNPCANCSIIMLSSGVSSFDGDELASVSDVNGLGSVSDLDSVTDTVGDIEFGGSFSGTYLSGAGSDNLCSPKSLSGLSDAEGICPEAPALEGTYAVAGLAFHAKTNDIRGDLTGDQNVNTYAVELSEALPSFDIPVGSGSINFLPSCESNSSGSATASTSDWRPCSLIDVEVLETTSVGGDFVKGTLLFHWEDSPWGNDYDQDGSQVIKFCVGVYCDNADSASGETWDDTVNSDQIRITSGVAFTSAGYALRFGFVVTGTAGSDGAPTGSEWLIRPGGGNNSDFGVLPGMPTTHTPVSRVFTAGTSSAEQLERPLWLAAKYGGFSDRDEDGTPKNSSGDSQEWDLTNNRTGLSGADGVPDNYFFVSNPSLLVEQLQRVFDSLVSRTASGTNAAVVANSSTGVGAVYQALYQPEYRDNKTSVSWVGTLQAIFIDDKGHLREDTDQDATLDDYSTDKIVRLFFDETKETTRVQYYSTSDNGLNITADGSDVSVAELKTVWSAADSLSSLVVGGVDTPLDPLTQRTYSSADAKRYIITAADENADGEVDQQDVFEFSPANFTSRYSYLGQASAADGENLVKFIRGQEGLSGYRSRSLDTDGSGTVDYVWRLGDIIHSTPAVVSAPNDGYDISFSDDTYAEFRSTHLYRRQMVYVGANDGMLHAFNGGFWNSVDKKFQVAPLSGTATNYGLGQEVWAYVPQNLLPHLRWLADPAYAHVYYMDGEPVVFDANVFADDATHKNGWGTILVAGMRFGGGDIGVDLDGDGTNDTTARSAYVVFDVTNPEVPPVLLGEISHPNLGFTLSNPTLYKERTPDSIGDWSNPDKNDWYLLFGSGPRGVKALSEGESDQNAKVFAVDLKRLVTNSGSSSALASYYVTGWEAKDTGKVNSWIGGLNSVDWRNDSEDDAVYFGTVGGTISSPDGALMRARFSGGGSVSTLSDLGHPLSAAPMGAVGSTGEQWVTVGSGRLVVPADNSSNNQEYIFGVQEPRDSDGANLWTSVSASDLEDVSDVQVFQDQAVFDSGSTYTLDGDTIGNFTQLTAAMKKQKGWKQKLEVISGAATGRVINQPTRNPASRVELAFTEYVPPSQSCDIDGNSYLWVISMETGTALPYQPIGDTGSTYVSGSNTITEAAEKLSIGKGQASKVDFHQGAGGNLIAVTNMSTGAIEATALEIEDPATGRQSWRQIDTSKF